MSPAQMEGTVSITSVVNNGYAIWITGAGELGQFQVFVISIKRFASVSRNGMNKFRWNKKRCIDDQRRVNLFQIIRCLLLKILNHRHLLPLELLSSPNSFTVGEWSTFFSVLEISGSELNILLFEDFESMSSISKLVPIYWMFKWMFSMARVIWY